MNGSVLIAKRGSATTAEALAQNRRSARQYGSISRSADVEDKVMLLLVTGKTPKEIAREIGYGLMGVYKIIYRLREHYGVSNDVQLGIAYISGGR